MRGHCACALRVARFLCARRSATAPPPTPPYPLRLHTLPSTSASPAPLGVRRPPRPVVEHARRRRHVVVQRRHGAPVPLVRQQLEHGGAWMRLGCCCRVLLACCVLFVVVLRGRGGGKKRRGQCERVRALRRTARVPRRQNGANKTAQSHTNTQTHSGARAPGGSSTALARIGPWRATRTPVVDAVARCDRNGTSIVSEATRTWRRRWGLRACVVAVCVQACVKEAADSSPSFTPGQPWRLLAQPAASSPRHQHQRQPPPPQSRHRSAPRSQTARRRPQGARLRRGG